VRKAKCAECDEQFAVKKSDQKYCGVVCRTNAGKNKLRSARFKAAISEKSSRICKFCGASFEPTEGGGYGSQSFCNAVCRIKWHGRDQTVSGLKLSQSASRRGAKVLETFSPFTIFERDGWRCKSCGCKTPKILRGLHDDKAPEIDHIVPVSKGGVHSMKNAQCLCRKCNRSKSNGAGGQLRLFG